MGRKKMCGDSEAMACSAEPSSRFAIASAIGGRFRSDPLLVSVREVLRRPECTCERGELIRRQRFRVQVALDQIAADLLQALQLRIRLDSFRDHVDTENLPH